MIKLIIFDLGGVVISIPEYKYFDYLARENDVSPYLVERIISISAPVLESGKISLSEFQDNMGREFGMPSGKVGWLTFFKKRAKLDEDVITIVESLSKNYKIAFLSNIDKWRYDYVIKHIMAGVLHLFSYKFASFRLGSVKPSPRIYREVLKRTGFRSSEVIFIDNNYENVEGARSVGMKSIKFSNPKRLALELKKFGIKLESV